MNMPINRHPEVIATRRPSVRPEDGGGLINIAGVEIRGTPTFLDWIDGKNPAGQLVQGALKSARDEKGNWIFWLEGKGTNYLLKNDKGALITNQSDAAERAHEMIKWGGASDLHPLKSERAQRGVNDFINYATDASIAIGNRLRSQNGFQQNLGGRAAYKRDVSKIIEIRTRVEQGELSVPEARKQIDQLLKNWGLTLPLTSEDIRPTPRLPTGPTQLIGAGAGGRPLPLFPLNKSSDLPPIKQPADYLPRMQYALERAAEWAGPEMADQLRALASPQGAAMLTAVLTLQLTPAGPAINTTLLALGGKDFVEGVIKMVDGVMNGTSVGDLNDAGRAFARGMSGAVIDVALGGLMHLTGVKVVPTIYNAIDNAKGYKLVRNLFAEPQDWQDVQRLLLFLDVGAEAYRKLPPDIKIAVRQGLVGGKAHANSRTQIEDILRGLNIIDELDTGVVGTRTYTPQRALPPASSTPPPRAINQVLAPWFEHWLSGAIA